MDSIKEQIEELRRVIDEHNHNYYVLNSPTISDYDFDMLLKQLEQLEREHPEYDDPYSPTHRVGSDLTKEFKQVRHERRMLSLSNTYTVGEVDDFVNSCKRLLPGEEVTITGEMKYDGTSISLHYEEGRLVRAVTRGDGEKGDDVTANIMTIKSIPLVLKGTGWPRKFEIRGEVLLPWKEFDRLNAEREFNEEPPFANPRNAASGTLKLQDPAEVAHRGLDAYLYYLLGDELPYDTHYDNMQAAREWGFKVSDIMTRLYTIDEVDNFISHWDSCSRWIPCGSSSTSDSRPRIRAGR